MRLLGLGLIALGVAVFSGGLVVASLVGSGGTLAALGGMVTVAIAVVGAFTFDVGVVLVLWETRFGRWLSRSGNRTP